MRLSALTSLALLTTTVAQLFQPDEVAFTTPVTVAPGLRASVIFSNLTVPRGIAIDSQQNILVVERGTGVTAFSRVSTPSLGWNRTVVVANDGFTHGIQVDDETLYVSTASDVLVYAYNPSTMTASAVPTLLITGLPADGGTNFIAILEDVIPEFGTFRINDSRSSAHA